MKKIITLATTLGFIATLSLNLTTTARSDDNKFKVWGRVMAIENNNVIKLQEPNGQIFTVVAKDDDQLERIRVGDMVSVKYEHGRVDSIKKIGESGYVPENISPPPNVPPPPVEPGQ
ncbi:MAG: hypothetical protein ACM3SR_10535 [Ignavibacteriales bacterium]|jgi:hypothetical protein